MSSKNNELFVNTYKEILVVHPEIKTYGKEDKCCSYGMCAVFSPIILPVWLTCCIGVTVKKMFCCSKKTSLETENQIPQIDTTSRSIAPKEILLNPRLK